MGVDVGASSRAVCQPLMEFGISLGNSSYPEIVGEVPTTGELRELDPDRKSVV